MNRKRFAIALWVLLCLIATAVFVSAQEKTAEETKPAKNEAAPPRARDGKKLLTALDLMKINGVSAPRISPDGTRVAYTVSETKMEKDKEWKNVKEDTMVIDHDIKMSHLWLFDIAKKEEKRLTEGNFTVSDPQWSPDGTRITYTTRPTPRADDGALSDVWLVTVANGEKRK